jgi:hypothetical protein
MTKAKNITNCEECKKKCKKLYRMEDGRKVCYKCKYRILKETGQLMYAMPKTIPIEDILNKEYDVKCGGSKKYVYGVIYANRALIGRKVKLILVEENKKQEMENGK